MNTLLDKVDAAFEEMNKNLASPSYDDVTKTRAKQLEKEINAYRNQLREEHLTNIGSPEYNVKSAMIYNNIFHALEKVGDHIINVTEAIIGEV